MTSSTIHPSAIISPTAQIGQGTTIGPYAIVGEQVVIGKNCHIDAHAIIHSHVRMGEQNRVHANAVIGGSPQDLSFNPALTSWVEIGDHNEFREGVTISRATRENEATRIGNHCFFMNNAHVAHDCLVGNHNIFATSATLGGHVQVGDRVFFGGGAMVHQFCRIGSFAMIAGVIGIRKDVLPYTLIGGSPVRHYRLNTIGLRRAGISGERYKALSRAFRCLKENKPLSDLSNTAEIAHLKEWLNAVSKRGIYGFIDTGKIKDAD
ncbi:MAG: acyl-ACP--UDP-N-acetylglucosamine O-acyltransferase [Pseudomonadales bacterium]|nr:acyl-ACP--UDP-N-acetylglucosamine O-acyltransferase [Pseudomonadales bacterium]